MRSVSLIRPPEVGSENHPGKHLGQLKHADPNKKYKKEDVEEAKTRTLGTVFKGEEKVKTTEGTIVTMRDRIEKIKERINKDKEEGEISNEEYELKNRKVEEAEVKISESENKLKTIKERIQKAKEAAETTPKL